jgi:hypothetical protein
VIRVSEIAVRTVLQKKGTFDTANFVAEESHFARRGVDQDEDQAMLKALELENFKAFGERTRIEFAPITLLFGENSAGKSSVLQALNLLKQTRENPGHGVLLFPRKEKGLVDLGSYQDLLFDHDLERVLTFRLDLEPELAETALDREAERDDLTGAYHGPELHDEVDAYDEPEWDEGAKHIVDGFLERIRNRTETEADSQPNELSEILGFEVSFTRASIEEEIGLKAITLHSSKSSGQLAVFEPIPDFSSATKSNCRAYREWQSYIRSEDPRGLTRFGHARPAKCSWVTEDRQFWSKIYDAIRIRSDWLLAEIRGPNRGLKKTASFYKSNLSLDDFVTRFRHAEQQGILMLDGFAPLRTPSRYCGFLPEIGLFRRHHPEWFGKTADIQLDLDMVSVAARVGRELDYALAMLFPLGPYRTPPERWYVFAGTEPRDVGFRGQSLPDLLFRRPELVHDVNIWLDKLEIGYHINVQSVGPRSRDLFEVRLIDSRRRDPVEVALSDVGYGISQILPFVVQCLAGEGQIITIEQPEVHIHPRLQAELGNLLAVAIKRPTRHRFIIETHSEHLVLRLQRLIREGKLKPDDVSIVYVSRGPNGSKAERLRLDDEGDFVDEWPGGFFPERLRELR